MPESVHLSTRAVTRSYRSHQDRTDHPEEASSPSFQLPESSIVVIVQHQLRDIESLYSEYSEALVLHQVSAPEHHLYTCQRLSWAVRVCPVIRDHTDDQIRVSAPDQSDRHHWERLVITSINLSLNPGSKGLYDNTTDTTTLIPINRVDNQCC